MPGIMTKILLGPLALALLVSLLAGQQSPPDLILLNGKIFTSDAAHLYSERREALDVPSRFGSIGFNIRMLSNTRFACRIGYTARMANV
jgi:small ligand-binding sensory domain FIST